MRPVLLIGFVLCAELLSSSPASAQRLFYLNRTGGSYAHGPDDSHANTTRIVPTTYEVGPWIIPDALWDVVVATVRDRYAPFNATFTDTDPGALAHIEVVFSPGTSDDVGRPGRGGLGAEDPGCPALENVIVFVFPSYWSNNPISAGETAAHEIGHSLGLDHVTDCRDLMGPRLCSEPATFVDEELDCRTAAEVAGECTYCGGTSQNSYARLVSILGLVLEVDAGIGLPDAAVASVDAGMSTEADAMISVSVDGGRSLDAAPDAGHATPRATASCGCRAASSERDASWMTVLCVAGLLRFATRRRRAEPKIA